MKPLTVFLRAARTQFTSLLNALIRALQIQRRAQLIAVLIVSAVIGFLWHTLCTQLVPHNTNGHHTFQSWSRLAILLQVNH